ncbi:hypothetical protein SNE40_008897 [Patella caerulea]|uniref:Uncharacterized protein n=2 Tax=Patella caerulea TaxID=87958 RepID=A0AAN8JTX4_PATCE
MMKLINSICILVGCFTVTQQLQTFQLPAYLTPGLNQGTVRSEDQYTWLVQPCSYLEAENVSAPYQTWSSPTFVNYRYQVCGDNCTIPPPIGVRSAVPLGGISTGSIELRADGTLHEWTIINQSPSSAAKIQIFDDAFFGIKVSRKVSNTLKFVPFKNIQTKKYLNVFWQDTYRPTNAVNQAFVLRTHPPSGLPGVQSLTYQGLYPSAQLTVNDDRLPLKNVSLTAMSTYFVNDMNSSATPAISFIFSATNPSKTDTIEASFMFNLPFGLEKNTDRSFTFKPESLKDENFDELLMAATSDLDCLNLCNTWDPCSTWTFNSDDTSCLLSSTVNLNGYNTFKSSGIKGYWTASQLQNLKCLTLDRPGESPPSGNISLCSNSALESLTFGVGNDINTLWNTFAEKGEFDFTGRKELGIHGAISAKLTILPGETVQFPMTMAWFYPNRDFGETVYGNWYRNLFVSSEDVAQNILNGEKINLKEQTTAINKLHEAFLTPGSSVPVWLSDLLINSLGHIRSAMWFADGKWRQWEAYDCSNMDSVHNDGERHIPYIMFFPGSIRNKMVAWAKSQLSDGMIPEQLQSNCFTKHFGNIIDVPSGRIMSDVSSMFIVYLLELYRWENDTALLTELWPYAKRAAEWHILVSKRYGLPYRLQNTYDVIGLDAYDICTYNSAFHLLGMRAAEELAKVMGDTEFASITREAFTVGQIALDQYLWNDTMGYYNSYKRDLSNLTEPNPGALMTDCFYAQVLAHSAGLGDLVDSQKLATHLKSELILNDSPYGMLVQTGRYPYPGPPQDNAVWMMGNPNWASTQLRLGLNPNEALNVAKKSLDRYRTVLNDLWNVAGVSGGLGYGADGQPYITSHYGYYMSSWHILLALSGQQADLPKGTLTFNPKNENPFNYPVLLPGVLGTITSKPSLDGFTITYTLSLLFGELKLQQLGVRDSYYPGTVFVKADQHVQWNDTVYY